MACTYIKEYLGNLQYVANGLLSIINTQILSDDMGYTPIKDRAGVCIPLTSLTVEPIHPFDCDSYLAIKNLLSVNSTPTASSATPGYLTILCDTLDCIPNIITTIDYGIKSQFERFACLCKSLKIRLESVCCNTNCPEVVGDLLCLIFEIISDLIAAITKAASIIYYSACAATGDVITSTFINCIVCEFVNDLCELDSLVAELSAIVVAFATCDSQICTPCYTAKCAPKKVRPICPANLSNGNHRPGCSKGNGCGCGCK